MTYLRLKNTVDLVSGENGYLLIDSLSGKLFDIELYESALIGRILRGNTYEEIIDGNQRAEIFMQNLINMGLARKVNTKYYEEKIRTGQLSNDNIRSTLTLNTLVVQLPLSCTKGCKYCGEKLIFGCFMCETSNEQFDSHTYKQLLAGLNKYKSLERLIITGGDIFRHYDNVRILVKALGLMNGVEVTILNNMSNIDEKIVKDLLKNKIQLIIMIDMTKNNMQNETALYQEKRVLLDMLKDQVRYYIVVDQELEQTNLAIVEGVDKKRVQYCYTIKNKRQLIENATYKRGLHVTNAQQASMRAKLHPCLTGMLAIDKNMNVLPCLKMKDQVLSKVDFETVNLYRNRKGIEKHWLSPVKRYMKCASCKYNITCMDCKAIESEYSSVYDKVCTRSL